MSNELKEAAVEITAKPKLIAIVGGQPVITEFDTEEERETAVTLKSPIDPVALARYDGMNKEQILCANLLSDLRFEFKKQIDGGLTVAEAADLFNRAQTTMLAIRLGWLRESRVLVNNTVTGGSFTAGRKTFLLNSIDAAIAQL